MAKISKVLRCFNCGAILQSQKKREKGYIDPNFIKTMSSSLVLFCDSCYQKMKATNADMLIEDDDTEVLKILDDAVATDALIIWIIDLFTFNGNLNENLVKKLKGLNIAVVGTKKDLLPRKVSKAKLTSFIEESFKKYGISLKGIAILGNYEAIDAQGMIKYMNEARRGHDVYVVGESGSGKTSFINRMLKSYNNTSKRTINREFVGTTSRKMLEIPLSNSSFLYEVPGFRVSTSVLSKVEKDVLKLIVPKKQILPVNKILNVGDCLVVGSLASFELLKGKPTTIKLYASNLVETRRVPARRIEELLEENIRKRYIRPVSDRYTNLIDFDIFDVVMEKDNKVHDLYVNGLCFVSLTAKGQTLRIRLPKGVLVKDTLSKVN